MFANILQWRKVGWTVSRRRRRNSSGMWRRVSNTWWRRASPRRFLQICCYWQTLSHALSKGCIGVCPHNTNTMTIMHDFYASMCIKTFIQCSLNQYSPYCLIWVTHSEKSLSLQKHHLISVKLAVSHPLYFQSVAEQSSNVSAVCSSVESCLQLGQIPPPTFFSVIRTLH